MNFRRGIVSFVFGLFVAFPMVVFAAKTNVTCGKPPADCVGQACDVKICPIKFFPQVTVPGFTGGDVTENTLGEYFRAIYVYFVSSVGVIAVTMIIFGGFRWITAAGNASKIQAAQETINSALIGLVLALTSFLILNTINPNLTRLRIPAVPAVEQLLQSTLFCKDGSLAAQIAGKTAQCGNDVPYTEIDGKPRHCISTYVDPNIGVGVGLDATGHNIPIRTKDALVCAFNKMTNGFEPVTIFKNCTDDLYTSNNECERADRQFLNDKLPSGELKPPVQIPGTATPLACRKYIVKLGGDHCILNPVLTCGLPSDRIKCNAPSGQNTPCWENGGPRTPSDFSLGLITSRCSDDPRAAAQTDAICCAAKSDVNSKKCQSDRPGLIDIDPDNKYVEFPPTYCQDIVPGCSSKCWIRVVLREIRTLP